MSEVGGVPAPVKIIADTPVVFADGVISQVYAPGISKFYFGRIDPDPLAVGPGTSVPVVQVVMPADGFVEMVAFLEARMLTMVEAGIISADHVEKSRAKWAKSK